MRSTQAGVVNVTRVCSLGRRYCVCLRRIELFDGSPTEATCTDQTDEWQQAQTCILQTKGEAKKRTTAKEEGDKGEKNSAYCSQTPPPICIARALSEASRRAVASASR